LEQVHVRGIVCRGLRLELVAGLVIALAMPALSVVAAHAQGLPTQTALTAETRNLGGRTQVTVAVTVNGEDGLPATGAVAIGDNGAQIAGAALNAQGQATVVLTLPAGDHSLTAAYAGDATHQASVSQATQVRAQVSSTPGFAVSVAPATLALTPGQSGTVIASVTPQNSAALTAPMFVTLSCSGLPDQAACTFTPENVEILPNATAPLTSSVVIATQTASASSEHHPDSNSVTWAFLLPGALGLGGLAWGARRRAWLNRLSLLALVGLVTLLGTTACNARYDYFNHGPPQNPATPAGTYTVSITAQSSNGVAAITPPPATLALTVQ
jgi:Big-like domain-containing protein